MKTAAKVLTVLIWLFGLLLLGQTLLRIWLVRNMGAWDSFNALTHSSPARLGLSPWPAYAYFLVLVLCVVRDEWPHWRQTLSPVLPAPEPSTPPTPPQYGIFSRDSQGRAGLDFFISARALIFWSALYLCLVLFVHPNFVYMCLYHRTPYAYLGMMIYDCLSLSLLVLFLRVMLWWFRSGKAYGLLRWTARVLELAFCRPFAFFSWPLRKLGRLINENDEPLYIVQPPKPKSLPSRQTVTVDPREKPFDPYRGFSDLERLIMRTAEQKGVIRASDFKDSGWHRNTISRSLRKLEKDGDLFQETGGTKGASYSIAIYVFNKEKKPTNAG